RRVNVPPELAPDELTVEKAHELVNAPVVVDRVIGINPANGKEIVAKDGRFGPYITELDPKPEQPAEDAAQAADASAPLVDPATGEVTEQKPKRKPAKKAAEP